MVAVALVAFLFWFIAPTEGDFAWSDAPRHAMNGIFVLDLLQERPVSDPKGWAEAYYIQYPALSVLFYPPLFSLVLAGFYWALGFSHETAQLGVAVFHFALMAGMYLLARRWMPGTYALGAALVLGAAPEIGFWARQVMLDIPAFAWLLWGVLFLLRYLRTERLIDLLVTAALLLASLYTKQNGIFALVPMAGVVVYAKGWRYLMRRHVVVTAALFAILLLPLVMLQVEFGSVNTASALGSERDDLARSSIAAWTYYLEQMPAQLGWPVVLLAALFVGAVAAGKGWRMPPVAALFLIAWVVTGYLFFSFIMVRQPRHDLMALWPVVIFALLGLQRLVAIVGSQPRSRTAMVAPLVLGVLMVGWSAVGVSVPYVKGYKAVAEYVVERAPADSNILFQGYRDGNFVFNVRASDRDDVGVLRADKLLLRLAIERERGVDVVAVDREELLEDLRRYRIRYVVSQPGFWTDLEPMRRLEALLGNAQLFRMVYEIDVASNYKNTDQRVRVYEYLGDIANVAEPISLEMVGIGTTFSEE